MKIVGFEANSALHLGVVEGDQVIDLQAVDKSIPGDLGECLQIDHLIVLDHAEMQRAIGFETDDFHGSLPRLVSPSF